MNILDENIVFEQRKISRRWRIPFRQIGYELSRQGIKDPQVIPMLLRLKQPTFFTRDFDYFDVRLCHTGLLFGLAERSPGGCGVHPSLPASLRFSDASPAAWKSDSRSSRRH